MSIVDKLSAILDLAAILNYAIMEIIMQDTLYMPDPNDKPKRDFGVKDDV